MARLTLYQGHEQVVYGFFDNTQSQGIAETMQVYTLGNDRVHDDLRVLMASLRKFNPDIPVTVIPWDDNIERTKKICIDYKARLLDCDLEKFDHLGNFFSRKYEKGNRIFRKFAAFSDCNGPFLFLDADCLVLSNLDCYFSAFNERNIDVLYYARAGRDRNFSVSDLKTVAERVMGNSEGYNAAWFLSRGNLFPFDFLDILSRRMLTLEKNFGLKHEQAFLNYCCLVYGCSVELLGNIDRRLQAGWNTEAKIIEKDGRYYFENKNQPAISVLHYSSAGWRTGVNKPLYDSFLNAPAQD